MLYRRALTREMALTTGAVLTVLVAIALVVLFIRLLGDVARGELANEAVFSFLGFSLLFFLPVLMTIALFAGVLLPLSRMWRDSEMVIWFNAGVSLTIMRGGLFTMGFAGYPPDHAGAQSMGADQKV